MATIETRGTLYAGTSGFAYADWSPRFYPTGARGDSLLRHYGARLNAVELNNTFYQQPRPQRIEAWLRATPDEFRFVVKAQRGGSMRALGEAAPATVAWLTAPYRLFGSRLGAVLYRVPEQVRSDPERLQMLLDVWPTDLPLVAQFQHASWHTDEVYDLLRSHRVAVCATDVDEADEPDLKLTGALIYVRLRRTTYDDAELARWADRLQVFLDSGTDCYVFLRHDEHGDAALRAERLLELTG